MVHKSPLKLLIILLILLTLTLSSCSSLPAPAAEPAASPVTLKIAVLPVLDTLPMHVAQEQGYFAAHGLQVEFIPVGSAPERDQIIAAGQADGMVNELLSTLFFNKEEVRVQTVRFARTATTDSPVFRILVANNSGIDSIEKLKGVEVGVSQGTVIEYLTDRLLEEEGFTPEEIKTVAVPSISDRMALLGSGELKAAMLPEPLSSLAVQGGARVLLDDSAHPEFSHSTVTFRKEVIDQHPEAIRAFLAAYEEAVLEINANPERWSTLLTEKKLVPTPLEGSFPVPTFVTAGVPDENQWNDMLAWAKEKALVTESISYKGSVNPVFLP